MKIHRKPDLLVMLVIIVGLGVAISSYIQYSRANPNSPQQSSLPKKHTLTEQSLYRGNFIRVATGETNTIHPISSQKPESVNKTYQAP